MFRISKPAPDRIDMDLEGKLDADEMRAALDALLEKCEGVSHGRMLYRIHDFDLPTLGALAVELKRLPALLGLIRRFDKAAVLANQRWVQRLSELEGALIPGLEIKAFAMEEETAAQEWLRR